MADASTLEGYEVRSSGKAEAGDVVAEIPTLFGCAADGPTEPAARANRRETLEVLKEAGAEDKLELPPRWPADR